MCGFQGTAIFTAQEEAGRSWRYALAWFQRERLTTQRLLVLDTSPYPSREAADAQQIVLRKQDAGGFFAEALTQEIAAKCDSLGISYSFKDQYVLQQNATRAKRFRSAAPN